MLRYKEDDGGILPSYMYPLVVIAAWTYPMKLIPPRTSCVALHYALIEVMESNGTYITTLPSKQVVDITLSMCPLDYYSLLDSIKISSTGHIRRFVLDIGQRILDTYSRQTL